MTSEKYTAVNGSQESIVPMQDNPQHVWRFQLLGGLRAICGSTVLETFQTQKTAVLLASLAYPPHRRHTREEMVDRLWPEAPPEAGRKRLSQALFWLRSHLEFAPDMQGKILLADRQSIGLDPQALRVDVVAFEAAARRTADTPAQIALLERAAALYQGDLLPICYDDWVLTERQRLLTLYLSTLQALVQHYEQAEDWERALSHLRRALAADPLAEDLHCTLMRLLWSSGQAEAALRQYRELERLLEREFGETPSPAARALMERIRQEKKSPAPKRSEPPRTPGVLQPLTRLFGRDAEVESLRAMLTAEGVRLVTLTGTAGAGKTRLAIEMAAHLVEEYRGAIWFVPLADVSDPALIPGAISASLRLETSEPSPLMEQMMEQITKMLARRPSLLMLDNLEHLVEGAGPLVRSLMERTASLKILVTSQQRLALEGEREFPVQPLSIPAWDGVPGMPSRLDQLMQIASVRLFVDRAQAVRPAFMMTPQNAEAIARICTRLEGLPLAIELCASWAQMLTPAQMLTQLAHRFDLLVSRRSDIAARHRSLRAALEYSCLLLSSDLHQFFVRLSIFRGGLTLEAAEAVCLEPDGVAGGTSLATLSTLTELHERSLLIAEEKPQAGTEGGMRYRMLEALREFAASQRTISMELLLRRRHAHFFLTLAEAAALQMFGQEQAVWLDQLEVEHENLRAALAWTLESSAEESPAEESPAEESPAEESPAEESPAESKASRQEIGLRLAAALRIFWETRGHVAEGQNWLKQLLASPPTGADSGNSLRVRAKATNALAYLARTRADFSLAEAAAREALELGRAVGEEAEVAAALTILASVAVYRSDVEGAKIFLAEALEVGRALKLSDLMIAILLTLGLLSMTQQDWPAAQVSLSESLALSQAAGNQSRIATSLNNLGLVARYQGDYGTAERFFRETVGISHRLSNRWLTAMALLNLGTVCRLTGRYAEAWASFQDASALALAVDNNRVMAWCIKELGHLACAVGQWETGIRLLSASESLRRTLGISFSPADPLELTRDVSLAPLRLTEAGFRTAWQEGGPWGIPRAYAEATQVFSSHDFRAAPDKTQEAGDRVGYEI